MGQVLNPGGQQHGRPVDAMETDDVFAEQVADRRPPGGKPLIVVPIARGGGIVGERVVPHIEHVALGPRHRDAPVDGGAGDGNVPQAAPD